MSTPEFKARIDNLSAEVDKLEKKVWFKDMCSMGMMAVIVAIPILIGSALYFLKPSFIMTTNDEDEKVVSKSKFVKWTLVLTIIGWVIAYFVSNYLKKKNLLKAAAITP